MAKLETRFDVVAWANRLSLTISHFARGSYPVRSANPEAMPVNRTLAIVSNPRGAVNRLRLEAGGDDIPFEEGCIYFIPAHLPVQGFLDDELVFVSIQFNLDYEGIELFSFHRSIRVLRRPAWVRRLERLFSETDVIALTLAVRQYVFALARVWIGGSDTAALAWTSRRAPYEAVFRYLREHGTARTRVTDLAELMSLRREVFTRRFTADFGVGPKHFLDRQLLRRAAERLDRPGATVREVAASLDFGSEFVFSRFFKNQIGISPKHFQQRLHYYRPAPPTDPAALLLTVTDPD